MSLASRGFTQALSPDLLDNLMEGYQVIGRDWRYLYINDAAASHGRRYKQDLLGRSMTDCYPGIQNTRMFALLRKCMEQRIPNRMENEFIFPDGAKGWFELRFEPVPEGVFILSIDISERKRAELRIGLLNSMLRGIGEVNQLIIRERDPRRLIQGSCGLLVESGGFDSCSIVLLRDGSPSFSADAGGAQRLAKMRELLEGGLLPECMREAATGRALVIRENPSMRCASCPVNGEYREQRDAIAVPLEIDGRLLGVLHATLQAGAAADVEEQGLLKGVAGDLAMALRSRELQDQRDEAVSGMAAAKEHLVAMVRASPAAMISLDIEGRVLSWNLAAERMLGWSAGEVIGKTLPSTPSDAADAQSELWGRILEGESFSGLELEQVKKNGERIRMEVSTAAIRDAQGRVMGVMAIGLDLSERIRAEERLRETNEKLLQAQKMEAVGRLAGGIAHDFNNILTAIYGYCDILLAKMPEGHPEHSLVEDIWQAGARAASLTQQLLAFSRRQTLQPKVVDLNGLVRNLRRMLARMIGEDVDLKLDLCDSPWPVRVDPARIEQALMNLAVNARDAMPNGGVLLIRTRNVRMDAGFISSHPEAAEGEYVMAAVSDDGEGMDEETRRHLFEPFFTTKEQGKGTGLGLSTVYGIVRQSGGSIWAYSEKGKGSTFEIYFPRAQAELEAEHAAAGRKRGRGRGKETLLYVEDDESVRSLFTRVLTENGYTVLTAANGVEAVREFSTAIPGISLMITDVIMPGMNGRELADRMKEINPALRVLYTSGYTSDAIAHRNILEEGTELVEKPIGAEALLEKIREMLDG